MAGMNDIDRRCDAYLNWLDSQRRDRTPVLTQIAAMGGSAAAIMGVAGAGTQALSIVATAFGLAGTTYANWNSRLLLDVDHSTVQTVVYTRQQQYRRNNLGVIVPDRAAAIYVLRGYLRICMPITIETDINTSVIMVRNDAPQSLLQKPLVRAVAMTAPLTPRAKVAQIDRPVGTVFDFSQILTAYNPSVDTVENLRAPLRALCANEVQIKDINGNVPSLQELIRFYQFSSTYQLGDTSLTPEVTGKLTPAQLRDLRKPSVVSGKPLVCQLSDVAANYYEFFRLPKGLKGKIDLLNRALPANQLLDSNASVEVIRERDQGRSRGNFKGKITLQEPLCREPVHARSERLFAFTTKEVDRCRHMKSPLTARRCTPSLPKRREKVRPSE